MQLTYWTEIFGQNLSFKAQSLHVFTVDHFIAQYGTYANEEKYANKHLPIEYNTTRNNTIP